MLKGLFLFGSGMYAGLYIAQNYEIDKVEDPQKLLQKIQKYLSELMEAPPKK